METHGADQVAADIAGKSEAATAVAINPTLSVAGTDEASTAAAVSQSSVTEPRGSKAASAIANNSVTTPRGFGALP